MVTIDTSHMNADEFIGYCTAKSLWPDDEASFEREWLRVRREREKKHRSTKKDDKLCR